MKLLLVSYMLRDEGQIPLGLLTLAEIARQEGVQDVQVTDLPYRQDEGEFVRTARDHQVVGLSSICSTYNQTIRLCGRLKAANPGIRVVLGGPQASLTAKASLSAFPFVDAIFVGEAEYSWRAFLRSLNEPAGSLEQVPGIVWHDGGLVRENEPAPIIDDLASLPPPALDLYHFSRPPAVMPIEIGRGCPFACSFCSSSSFFRRKFRLRPVARIIEEMDRLHDLHNSQTFFFVQDSFTNSRAFVEEMCQALSRRRQPYTWYCSARTDQISDDLVVKMKSSGCRGVYFGLETGSQRMQKVINKRLNVERAVNVIRRTAEQGLEVTTSMIIGFPQESLADLRDTLRVFFDLKAAGHALVQLHVLAPLLGSALSREGHELRYDQMPSDFADTAKVLDSEDRSLIEGHPEIFASFWHFVNPSIPRERLLFLSQVLTLASMYFPNTLSLAAKQAPDTLLDRLLTDPTPSPWPTDPTHPAGLGEWLGLISELLQSFVLQTAPSKTLCYALEFDLAYCRAEVLPMPAPALLRLPPGIGVRPGRRIVDGLQAGEEVEAQGEPVPYVVQKPAGVVEVFRIDEVTYRALKRLRETHESVGFPAYEAEGTIHQPPDLLELIADICAPCGECCFETGGILCGSDEWLAIRHALAQGSEVEPAAVAFEGSDLLLIGPQQRVSDPQAADRSAEQKRTACPALRREDGRWRCSIEAVKPAGCIAYPLKLTLREQTTGTARWSISLEFEPATGREPCPLEKLLRSNPGWLDRYCEDLRQKLANREGAFALAAYNRSASERSNAFTTGEG